MLCVPTDWAMQKEISQKLLSNISNHVFIEEIICDKMIALVFEQFNAGEATESKKVTLLN